MGSQECSREWKEPVDTDTYNWVGNIKTNFDLENSSNSHGTKLIQDKDKKNVQKEVRRGKKKTDK